MARTFRKTTARLILAGGVAIAALAVADRSAPLLGKFSISFGDGAVLKTDGIRLGNGLIGSALAQSPGEVTIDNVEVASGTASFQIPRITFSGVNLSREELTSLFGAGGSGALWERLASISADSVEIPEIVIEQNMDGVTQRVVYENVTATDIVDGRIGEIVAAGGAFEAEGGDEAGKGSFGRTSIKGFDLPLLLQFYTRAAGDGPNPRRTVYESFELDDLVMTAEGEVEFRIARLSGSEFTLRLLQRPFEAMAAEIAALEGREDPTPEETARLMSFVADVFDAFGFEEMEATEITMRSLRDEAFEGRISRIAFTSEGASLGTRLENLSIETEAGSATIDSISSEGFSFQPMIESMRQFGADPAAEIDEAALRRMVPAFGTVTIAGLDADIAPEGPGSEMGFSMGQMQITADAPHEGIPTNFRFAFDNVAFDVPADSGVEGLEQVRALGYERIDVSGVFASQWNKATNEVVITEFSFSGEEMGSVALRGVLGNMTEAITNPDQDVAKAAVMNGTLKNVHLMIDDEGLAERLLERQAEEMGATPDALRMQFGMMATAMMPAMLGGSAQAQALAEAVGAFIAEPGELEVSAVSREQEGVPLKSLRAIGQPAGLLEQFEVSAEKR